MSDDEGAPMLPVVGDGPMAPQRDEDDLPPRKQKAVRQNIGDIPPIVRPQEPTAVIQPEKLVAATAEYREAVYKKPDPWANVPIDTYWFGRTWSRSPNPDEYREWEFELVTTDNRGQRNRLLARVDGPYGLALDRARAVWEPQLGANVRADKIMVLSS